MNERITLYIILAIIIVFYGILIYRVFKQFKEK